MSIRNCALTLALWVLSVAAHAQGVEGTDYRKIEPPQPTISPGKIEVIEFFSYMCPHCNEFYPLVTTWAAKLPRNVVFRRVPVGFSRPPWINLARAYYALQASGDLDKLDGALFRAIHEEHLQLFDEPSLGEWVAKNGGNADKFAAAYTPFGGNNQTVQADQLVESYRIDSVPRLGVNGEFQSLPTRLAEVLSTFTPPFAMSKTPTRA